MSQIDFEHSSHDLNRPEAKRFGVKLTNLNISKMNLVDIVIDLLEAVLLGLPISAEKIVEVRACLDTAGLERHAAIAEWGIDLRGKCGIDLATARHPQRLLAKTLQCSE